MKPSKISNNQFPNSSKVPISKFQYWILAIVYALTIVLIPISVQAAALPDLLPACVETGACRICDIVNVFVTLGRWLIAGAAALALLVIVFAASNIVTSAGKSEAIAGAKKQIVGAVL